jgi:hypothetical protein
LKFVRRVPPRRQHLCGAELHLGDQTVTAVAAGSSNNNSGKASTGVVLGIVGLPLGAAARAVVLLRQRPARAS